MYFSSSDANSATVGILFCISFGSSLKVNSLIPNGFFMSLKAYSTSNASFDLQRIIPILG